MHVSAVAPKILLKNLMYTLLCGVYLASCYSNKQFMQRGRHLCRVNCLHFLKTRVLERSQKTFYLNCALHCRIMLQSIFFCIIGMYQSNYWIHTQYKIIHHYEFMTWVKCLMVWVRVNLVPNLVPRLFSLILGARPPAEKIPWYCLVTCLPESGR
jgi:hypothetical protein